MLRVFCLLMGLSFVLTLSACPKDPTQISTQPQTVQIFLYDAILTGLKKDRAPKEMIAILSKSSIFVPKCGLCTSTRKALAEYRKAPRSSNGTFPFQITTTTTRKEQMLILSQLVHRYTEQHFTMLKLSKADEERMRQKLEDVRERSTRLMRDDFGSFCPSCDGACARPQSAEGMY